MAKLTKAERQSLRKAPTGIDGLDQITGGGLPQGRPTLICGGPGCGKSLMGIEFLVRGATEFGEPGIIMTFDLPNLTAFVTVFFAVAALAVVFAIGSLATFLAQNHQVRVRRHEGVFQYYGHLVLGH